MRVGVRRERAVTAPRSRTGALIAPPPQPWLWASPAVSGLGVGRTLAGFHYVVPYERGVHAPDWRRAFACQFGHRLESRGPTVLPYPLPRSLTRRGRGRAHGRGGWMVPRPPPSGGRRRCKGSFARDGRERDHLTISVYFWPTSCPPWGNGAGACVQAVRGLLAGVFLPRVTSRYARVQVPHWW